jgi:hypothetical protein
MRSSYSFTTSALDGVSVVSVTPGPRFRPGERTPVPIVQEAAPQSRSGHRIEEKSFRLCRGLNFDRPVIKSVSKVK